MINQVGVIYIETDRRLGLLITEHSMQFYTT